MTGSVARSGGSPGSVLCVEDKDALTTVFKDEDPAVG